MFIESPDGGLDGGLEARWDDAANADTTCVLCHPHPQYGGSMHDAVLQTAADVLLDAGISCLRFNFRGVGASGGHYDNGVGEVDDLLAASAWAANNQPDHAVWWLGYSFGAAVVWSALAKQQPARAILIAPPIGMMDLSASPPAGSKIAAIAGDRDNFVDSGALTSWSAAQTQIISGADHFFSAHHAELADAIKTLCP